MKYYLLFFCLIIIFLFNLTNAISNKKLDIGKTGLPLPRFVTLKYNKVNVRKGPNKIFDITWQFNKKYLPVEILAEYDNWRKIRDHFGEEGWVFYTLLSNNRYGLVNPWETKKFFTVHNKKNKNSEIIIKLESGVLTHIKNCNGIWCQINKNNYQGYIKQEFLWGVYINEKIK